MILKDAEKEFDSNSRISYGIDGNEEIKEKDFAKVRGSYDENSFIIELRKEIDATSSKFYKFNSLFN